MSSNIPITESVMFAERSVIGSILIDENTLDIAREILKPEDFYAVCNQEIFGVMCHLQDVGKKISTAGIYSELASHKTFEDVGGINYLIECSNQLPNTNMVEHYSEIVKNESSKRRLFKFADVIKDLSSKPVDNLNSEIARLSDEMLGICSENNVTPWQPFDKVLERACNALFDNNKSEVISSGFVDLDEKITGFRPGEFIVIAARPGVGKTALGLNIFRHVTIDLKLSAAFFSLEMTDEELAYRMISCMSSVNGNAIRQQHLTDEEWNRFLDAVEVYKSAKDRIIIDDTPAISISTLRERAKRIQRQFGIKMIIIDYLQLMTSASKKVQSREQEIADVSRELKRVAKELHVPVIAMAQLNRAVETRSIKQPIMSDIRDSGSIEQDADKIFFISREGSDPKSKQDDEAEILIAKHRNGPTGTIKLYWEGQYTRFSNLEHNDNYF